MTNRVKKLLVVEEDQLPKEVQERILSGVAVGGGKTSDFVQQQVASPFTTRLDKEILLFNEDIQDTIKKPLPTKLKALELLQKVNRLFALLQQREDQQRDEILAEREGEHQHEQHSTDPSSITVAPVVPVKQTTQIDPSSVMT